MAEFGNKITDLSQVSVGATGYTVRIDTTKILAYVIEYVQGIDSGGDLGDPSGGSQDLKVIQTYCNADDPPDIAFNYAYGLCTVFLKTSVYPYIDTTRIALFGKRTALKMETANDNADFPDTDWELFVGYAIRTAAIMKNRPIPTDISQLIRNREQMIREGY